MITWWVYDEDGDCVESVKANSAAEAIATFSYAQPSWFAVPDGWTVTEAAQL